MSSGTFWAQDTPFWTTFKTQTHRAMWIICFHSLSPKKDTTSKSVERWGSRKNSKILTFFMPEEKSKFSFSDNPMKVSCLPPLPSGSWPEKPAPWLGARLGGAGDVLRQDCLCVHRRQLPCSGVPPVAAVVFSLQKAGCWQPWPS